MRALLLSLAALAGCGYRVAGTADTVPKNVRTVAVPAFGNATTHYKLTDRLPSAIVREFNTRTRYQTIQDPGAADAILEGNVLSVLVYPTIFDPLTARAAGVETIVNLSLRLRERTTGNLIYNQPAFAFRQRYEISIDPSTYFDESSVAFQRLSSDVARAVVSAVLENF
ncbi:MAG: LPS assembly lipoprotein LptE [Bryobacteraceae bacterium]|nr:LPS assembly lipoprotein LptE [Bryobacteraceae bacterium]